MLKKLYIDNFRCMQNFSVTLTNYQLWLGSNGSGKTSVLDVLRNLQRVLAAENVADIFKRNSLTVWDMRLVQTFRVELEIGGEDYEYELAIEHMKGEERCRIQEEKLIWKGSTFYHFDGSEAHLYRINNNSGKVEEGTHFTADWSRSVIPTIAERDDNRPLIRFREEVRKWLIVQPIPISKMMTSSARNESPDLNRYCENFSEWYRYIL
ncbi:MAG TPA: AAA family ATPase, partial [Lentisphaeria bacterium]|nr:AAA family ATPase [Lentisphaeria bacterium]